MPRNLMISCYPDHRVHPVVGNGSADWNKAIECWAAVLAVAAQENAKVFDRDEWAFLAKRLGPINRGRDAETRLPTHYSDPGAFLGGLVADTPIVAQKLSQLDYTHAWAVLKAIDWRLDLDAHVKPSHEWWLPSYWAKAVDAYVVRDAL